MRNQGTLLDCCHGLQSLRGIWFISISVLVVLVGHIGLPLSPLRTNTYKNEAPHRNDAQPSPSTRLPATMRFFIDQSERLIAAILPLLVQETYATSLLGERKIACGAGGTSIARTTCNVCRSTTAT